MAKHPSIIQKAFQPGEIVPGVACKGCSTPVPFGEDAAGLPDQFDIVCPKCGLQATYRKSEIRSLKAHRKQ